MCKPYERADIVKPDGAVGFCFFDDVKACIFKCLSLFPKIQMRERLLGIGQYHFNQIAVVVAADLLCDKDSALFQQTEQFVRVEIAVPVDDYVKAGILKRDIRRIITCFKADSERRKRFPA